MYWWNWRDVNRFLLRPLKTAAGLLSCSMVEDAWLLWLDGRITSFDLKKCLFNEQLRVTVKRFEISDNTEKLLMLFDVYYTFSF